ncbi:putative nucleotidyltransferase [Gammaproteobacteria bacterium]
MPCDAMRLSEAERQVITAAVAENFGTEAQVWLFGSCVDDARQGGDIDLYVEAALTDDLPRRKGLFIVQVWRRIGARRIDLLVRSQDAPLRTIHRNALETGIRL